MSEQIQAPTPLSRPSKAALHWIKLSGGVTNFLGGAALASCWSAKANGRAWRYISHQTILILEARGLIRFTETKVCLDGVARPVKAELVA